MKLYEKRWSIEMMRWICHHQNEEGGRGLHTCGPSTLFATVLYYVTLRILGMEAGKGVAVKARERLHPFGKSYADGML